MIDEWSPQPTAELGGPKPFPFEKLGRAGRAAPWRLLAVLALIPVFAAILLVLLTGLMLLFAPLHELRYALSLFGRVENWNKVEPREAILAFCILLGFVAAFLPAVLIAARMMHGRPIRTFLTGRARFNFRAAFLSFVVFALLSGVANLISYALDPGSYRYVLNASRFFLFLPFVAILLPLQVLAEETLFRGWILQAVGRFTSNRALLVGVPSAIFALAHFQNPEVGFGGEWVLAFYIVMAVYLTWITIRGNGLEYAFGLHLANNLIVFSIVGNAASPYPSPTIFYATSIDFALDLAAFAAMILIHYGVCFGLFAKGSD